MRIVLADDHVLLRCGIAELLTSAGFDVVGQAGDVEELFPVLRSTNPDVVLLDIRMPPTHSLEGLEAAHVIRAEFGSAIGIILLSHYVETRYLSELLRDGAGGIGYLLKDRILDADELSDAIRRVAAGGSAVDPLVIQQLLTRHHTGLAALTGREREVLAAMAEGRSNQSISELLHISDKTVESCTSRIFTKLGLAGSSDDHRRVKAVLAFLNATR
ncbi:MAG: response regulator transcription factor [Ilumatobacteraceae bacterium]